MTHQAGQLLLLFPALSQTRAKASSYFNIENTNKRENITIETESVFKFEVFCDFSQQFAFKFSLDFYFGTNYIPISSINKHRFIVVPYFLPWPVFVLTFFFFFFV